MMKLLEIKPWAGLVVALITTALAGCVPKDNAGLTSGSGGASPVEDGASPKSRLESQRLADATRGLRFTRDQVEVTARTSNDRPAAVAKTASAVKVMNERNIWFVAVGAFRDAVLADPRYAPAYVGLADALLMEGKTDLAQAALRTAVRLDGRDPEARYRLGLLRQMDSDYAGAVLEWTEVVKFAPDHADVYARMAIASYYARDYRSAWEYLSQAEARKQNVPPQFKPMLLEVSPRP
ncbi:MAG: tetratricopeptide repeat protein [Fimbriimonadaceae bacterium]|nr:tetratricopeptide repeat protein [Fimbriimonadaceae bacterium]QYK58516.1 MAG: tetratricopeptide repeat protein [Fimbriimonadaceae bacterium]